ncbi:LysR family transcriptional regulator [Seohaeicola nanhaiensis]|uniref:LysR family transcriptional regulator n=1 Tax=Seohaeicola nanhaiensis TaxID=1387282 RepID=A0ABV9KNV2_9RHOB
MHNANWDNLRYVLAVADRGSLSAAAKTLGVNHATVLRRVAAFEEEHGGPVFEKTASGYRVLADRARVIEAAREVANAMVSVERLMDGARAPVRGVVRISSTDSLCQVVLPSFMARMQAALPELRLDYFSSNAHLDFARLQADIAVRPAERLPDELSGETNAQLTFRAYSAPSRPGGWVGMAGPLVRSAPAAWMAANVEPEAIAGGADSFVVLRELCRAGVGVAILPVYLGEGVPGLVARPELMADIRVPVWVASYTELRDVPRIRIVREHLLAHLAEQADLLGGR